MSSQAIRKARAPTCRLSPTSRVAAPISKALAAFLADPHPKMPDMHLSRSEIDDIVAYIQSLNPKARPPAPDGKDIELPKKG